MGAITDLITVTTTAPQVRIPHNRPPSPKQRADSLYIHTCEPGSGKALISLGILDLIQKGIISNIRSNAASFRIGFFRPLISSSATNGHDEDIDLILQQFQLPQSFEESYGIRTDQAKQLLGQHHHDQVIDTIIAKYKALEAKCDFVLCEGRHGSAVEFNLNVEMAKHLACPILVLGSAKDRTVQEALETIQISIDEFEAYHADIVGVIINKADPNEVSLLSHQLEKRYKDRGYIHAVIPYQDSLMTPRIYDVVEALHGQVLYGKQFIDNRVKCSMLGTMQLQHVLNWFTQDDCLLVTSGDRGDILIGALQAHQSTNYPRLSGIVLTGGERPDPTIELLLDGALDTIPIIFVEEDSFSTAAKVNTAKASLRHTDLEKISLSIHSFSNSLFHNKERLLQRVLSGGKSGDIAATMAPFRRMLTPAMFAYELVTQAQEDRKHIVLPEGTDPRIIQAAAQVTARNIAHLTLLGKPEEIIKAATELGVAQLTNSGSITLLDPCESHELLDKYSKIYYELRKHKGNVPNLSAARDQVMDYTCFGTMMVHCGDADGLVSGARHTTRHTIRPALQIIKTKPGVKLVSSVFLMCLDHHVLVYGDCAVNPSPNSSELADIAIASAETAVAFGIEPKVAMLSYSSGDSGKGCEVEKVREATRIARGQRPDLLIEGPIQYDAAVDPEVASSKMPNSAVAGQASVFVFPDLSAGNTCYKSIQRETVGAVCIGPILQGLKKPVNDLSRGCTVEDIVSTIVVTACQAQQAV